MTEKRWFTNKNWFLWAPLALIAIVLFVFLGGTVVMLLWNWLLPPLFGWGMLNFWQALGILLLSRILLGGFGSHGPRASMRHGMGRHKDKDSGLHEWLDLTPEEREKFRQGLKATGIQNP